MIRNLGCIIILIVINLFCLAAIAVGIRVGIAYGYTAAEWLEVFTPASLSFSELSRWLGLIATIGVPVASLALVATEVLRQRRKDKAPDENIQL